MIAQHRAQRGEIAGNDSLHGRLEAGDIACSRRGFGERYDISPLLEAVLMRHHQPCVAGIERRRVDISERLATEAWMLPLEARARVGAAGLQRYEQRLSLALIDVKLGEIRRPRPSTHAADTTAKARRAGH